MDEDAVWAALVAAYGEQPDPETGRWPATGGDEPDDERKGPVKEAPEPALPEQDQPKQPDRPDPLNKADGPGRSAGSFIVYAPGVGPRDHTPAEEGPDEGHFVPPEPPPLPSMDVTARFAWLAVLGGPLLLLVMVLLRQELTWWITTLGVGGFLGGFATLVIRMKDGDDEEDDDPGRGAVV
ncbi:hypothetical protein AB0I49_32180 [Streptomyces sp. NPDC050617]|uniref:hypothetical protein n=1 Tax=Streptomyces sp. NPDC050617 TaxID=3154628 RepID=UPI00343663FF